MWRRLLSLSPLISSFKSSFIAQEGAYSYSFWESLTTNNLNEAKGVLLPKGKPPFIAFVLDGYNPEADQQNSLIPKFNSGPGSGKGTQCAKIVETFGLKHLSAGDLLRREISSNSPDGTMILNTIKYGKIVPSEITVRLIQKEIESSDTHKFLIDGFPRSEENRSAFEKITGAEPDLVLFFDCLEDEMVKRVLNRNQGRVDDNIHTMKKRLEVFHAISLPVIDYYSQRGKLYKINAVGTEDEIFEQVRPVFAQFEELLK